MEIILDGSLGDGVALTGAVREYKKQHPEEYICVYLKDWEIFINNPHVGWGSINTPIKKLLIPKYIDMSGNFVRGYCKELGIRCYDDTPGIFLTQEERFKFTIHPHAVAIDTWAGWPCKRYRRWTEAIDLLREYDPELKFYEVGKAVPDCFGKIRGPSVLPNMDADFVDLLSIRDTAALLSKCILYMGSDSGLFHVAASVGVPQLVLFAAPFWSKGYHNTYPLNNADFLCPDCNPSCKRGMGSCLDAITPQDILEVYKVFRDRYGHT